jgi:hypothetical protein
MHVSLRGPYLVIQRRPCPLVLELSDKLVAKRLADKLVFTLKSSVPPVEMIQLKHVADVDHCNDVEVRRLEGQNI